MLHKPLNSGLKIVLSKKLLVRHSALFVNGAKATETFVYLNPHIDFPDRVKNKQNLQEELRRRKSNFDLCKLEDLWAVYEELRQRKSDFVKKKAEVSRELGILIKNEPDSKAIEKYKVQSDLLKDNIKKLKVPLWSAEETAIVEALRLPNSIHHLTPDEANKIIHTHLNPPSNKKDHLKIANNLNIIHFKKNENYYLKRDAAIFELGAKFYFSNILKKNKFVQFSNPDFVKSVILEGCGEDHTNPDKTFILHHDEDAKVNKDSRLHLTGGGSLSSYMAYHAKNIIYPKNLPLKYFSIGRQYIPAPSDEDSLFNVSQSSVIQLFVASRDFNELDRVLNHVTEVIKEAYTQLGFHFRLSFVAANELLSWESLRLSIEMFSTSLNSHVEVGNVSVSGDYISKRLMFTYVDKKESRFPHILSGTILNVPKLLGCVLEQDGSFTLPKQFHVDKWSL